MSKQVTATNKKIINAAKNILNAMHAETEEILYETEQLVKDYFPAKYVKAALKEVEQKLDENAIEASFEKVVTPEMRTKTASVQATSKEMRQAIQHIANAAVSEMEDMLADANEVINRTLTRFAAKERPSVEAKLKNLIENRMHNIGVYCKFDRITYDPNASMKKAFAALKNASEEDEKDCDGEFCKIDNRILAAMYKDSKR